MIDRMTPDEALAELRAAGYEHARYEPSLGPPMIYLNDGPQRTGRISVAPYQRLVDCDHVWRAVHSIVVAAIEPSKVAK